MRHSWLCRDATTHAKQGACQRLNKVLGIVACAVIVSVMMTETTGRAWSRGGYGGPKPPTAFAPKELLLIEKCKEVARTEGADSAPFMRECSAVRSYVYY
jgi:hypothetical protein